MTTGRLTGTYLLGPEPLILAEDDDGLSLSTIGLPPAFAARATVDGDAFRIDGGPMDGAPLVFADGDPCPGGIIGGLYELTRAPAGVALPGGRGLVPPRLDLSPREIAHYRALLEAIERDRDGGWLELEERPRWRFVEWLSREERVIFHGSPEPEIEVFTPVRRSVELMDRAGTGNLAAVYGTSYGLWAMWFAVLARPRLRGSIQNGVIRWSDRTGGVLDVYHFSVHDAHVSEDVWRPGTLYLLPREPFRPNLWLPGGSPTGEWTSPEEVRPLKRVALEPEDFPFRELVGGHDDTDLIRADELSRVVLDRVRSARRTADGLELTLEWDVPLAEVAEDYLESARRFTPDVDRRLVRRDAESALLEIRGPGGVLQALEGSLARREIAVD